VAAYIRSFFIFQYACSITISNTTCFDGLYTYFLSKTTYLLYTQVSDFSTCYFILCNFLSGMLSTNFFKNFGVYVSKSIFAYGPVF